MNNKRLDNARSRWESVLFAIDEKYIEPNFVIHSFSDIQREGE